MPLSTPSLYPQGPLDFAKFNSRRSVVHSTKGIVACTQPLAAKCGIDILNAGGNAAVSDVIDQFLVFPNKANKTLILIFRMPPSPLVRL